MTADGEAIQVSLVAALAALDEALEEVEGLKARNQFLTGAVKFLEEVLARQRSTIARLEGERDTWRAKGEYK